MEGRPDLSNLVQDFFYAIATSRLSSYRSLKFFRQTVGPYFRTCKGTDEGKVEGMVEYVRRNLFVVPVPRVCQFMGSCWRGASWRNWASRAIARRGAARSITPLLPALCLSERIHRLWTRIYRCGGHWHDTYGGQGMAVVAGIDVSKPLWTCQCRKAPCTAFTSRTTPHWQVSVDNFRQQTGRILHQVHR